VPTYEGRGDRVGRSINGSDVLRRLNKAADYSGRLNGEINKSGLPPSGGAQDSGSAQEPIGANSRPVRPGLFARIARYGRWFGKDLNIKDDRRANEKCHSRLILPKQMGAGQARYAGQLVGGVATPSLRSHTPPAYLELTTPNGEDLVEKPPPDMSKPQ